MKHYITKYRDESGRLVVKSWLQLNLFGKCFCFWEQEKVIVNQQPKSADDYINIRIPNNGDLPIVYLDGEEATPDDEGIESVKFIWVTETDDSKDNAIPFVEVRTVRRDINRSTFRSMGDELEADEKRIRVRSHNNA